MNKVSQKSTPVHSHSRSNAFTVIELLVALAILSMLILLTVANFHKFIAQGYDARRKSDLKAYRIAFERYYEDKKCWPPGDAILVCGSDALQPYLSAILCDPRTKKPYHYVPLGCSSYKLYTELDNTDDPDISSLGCTNGCGVDTNGDLEADDNYGVGSGNVSIQGTAGSATPPPGTTGGIAILGTCTLTGGKKCYADICSSCCPGTQYRCDSVGIFCISDLSCGSQ